MTNYELFDYIKSLCQLKGLTIAQLAREAGISKSTIYNVYECRTGNLSTAVANKLAGVLGCSAAELMRLKEDRAVTAALHKLRTTASGAAAPKEGTAADAAPTAISQMEITVLGKCTVVPQDDDTIRMIAKGIKLKQSDLNSQVKLYLFNSAEVSDQALQAVKAFALRLKSMMDG